MANDRTISIGFKVEDGANGLKTLIVDADNLRKVLASSVVEATKLQGHFINFASISTGIDSISSTLNSVLGFVDDLTAAYDVQESVETRLAQVMRNTMDAREEDIQSIKDFCSAQQGIGVVGDEVQLAGAQELATYLELKSSLRSLIPVMNDMLVQQNGLASTGENAAQIATMLGKVMEGQTGALSRYGYKFDEAQEQILKYGTEAEKVKVLVDVVSASVGGMNETMAKTPAGRMQQIANNLGDMKEQLGGVVKGAQSILTVGANATIALGGVMKLITGLKTLNATLKQTRAAAGWIGLALTAVTSAVIWFMNCTNVTTDSLDRFKTAEERAAEAAQRLADAEEIGDNARHNAMSSLETYKTKIDNFNGTKEEEQKLVKELNTTYGSTMGYFKNLSDWYKALTQNSKAYCDQMVAEAKTRKYADQIADLEIKREKIVTDDKGNRRFYSTKANKQTYRAITPEEAKAEKAKGNRVDGGHVNGRYVQWAWMDEKGTSDLDAAQATYDDYTKQLANLRKLSQANVTKVKMPVMGAAEAPDLTDNKGSKETTRLQEINRLLAKYQEQYVAATDSQREQIRQRVSALTDEKNAIELAQAEMERPVRLDSLEAYDREIAYHTKLRSMATAGQVAGIDETISLLGRERSAFELAGRTEMRTLEDYDKELSRLQNMRRSASGEQLALIQEAIDRTNDERDAMERSSRVRVPAEKISSYRQLEEQIRLCNEMLRYGTDDEKNWASENLPLLQRKERVMSSLISAVGVAEKPEDADSLEEIGAAITLLDDKIQRASADEIEALTRSKMAFEDKKKAYERGIEIPAMQREVAELIKLPDKVLRVKIKAMGFDALSEKLREIQGQLDDVDNPPTDGQRKALESLKATYEEWRRQCVMSMDTAKKGWQSLSGAVGGMESITRAIKEGADAWSILTSIVNGFISIYEGIEGVISVMETIGALSKANTAAKTAEAAATMVSTTATVAEAATDDAAAAAKVPAIAANKALTASFLELAAAEYMAAHAGIPFAGFGIGAGFASSATAIVKGIGAMAFADGGVVYGPTLGLVGEYAGARSNPEVIAPLNKLRDLIGDTGRQAPVIIGGRLEFSGRKLAVVLENQSKISGLSGKHLRL